MKFNITHQQPFSSLMLHLAITIAGVVALIRRPAPPQTFAVESLLGGYVNDFQNNLPIVAAILCGVLLFWGANILGRHIIYFKLYGSSSSIQIPILGLFAWGMALSEEYLLCSLIIFIMSIMITQLFKAIRGGYIFGELFNSTMLLSLLPLFYPPAIMLIGVIPIALIIMGVTLREWIVAMIGIIFPPITLYYIIWLCTGLLFDNFILSWSMVMSFSGLFSMETAPIHLLLMASVATLLALSAAIIEPMSDKTHNTRLRTIILIVLFFGSAATVAMPSSNLLSLSLITPSAALLVSLFVVKSRTWVANLTFFVIVGLYLFSIIYPLYVPIGEF